MANTLLITKETGEYFGFTLSIDGVAQPKIRNMRNDAFTVDNICHFKTANGANIVQKQNITVFDVTLIAGGTFTFTDIDVFLNKLIEVGYFDWFLDGGGSGGVNRFDALEDTFDYFGRNGQTVIVNESELKLETIPLYNYRTFTDLEDTPDVLVADKMLVVSSDGLRVELKNQPTPPEQYLQAVGYFDYADLATQTVPLTLVANVPKKLTNDTLGVSTNLISPPYGVSNVWNSINNQFDFSELSIGDTIDIRFDAKVTTTINNQVVKGFIKIAVGSPSEYILGIFGQQIKTAGTNTQTVFTSLYIGSEDIYNYPSEVYIVSENAGSVSVNGWYCRVLRKGINIVELGDDFEVKINKQNSLAPDGTGNKYPTVDIVSVKENTGTVLSLDRNVGTYYNMYSANTATTYTTDNLILGGKAVVLVNASSEPIVTSGTKINGDLFTPNQNIYMIVWNNGNRIEYYFKLIEDDNPIDLTATPYGVKVAESLNPSVVYLGTPSIVKTSTGRLLVSHDYNSTSYNTSAVYKSDNGGQTWSKCQDIFGVFWGKLFIYGSDVYLLGVSNYPDGNISISKSTDNGSTWSTPVNVISYLEKGFVHTSSSFIIKDGYLVSAFEIMANTGVWSGWHKSVLVFGNLSDLMNPSNWSLSNQITFNSALYPATIGTNGTDTKRPATAPTASKGWLEGNLITKPSGDLMILFRLEQSPNSNNAIYLDVTWNSGTPTSSTISSTPNYIEMQGGNVKFTPVYDATSGLYWTVTNVNKYKWFNDYRMEAHLLSSPDLLTWTVKEKALGYNVTSNWEAEIPQFGVQYSDVIIDGDDLLICTRTSDALAQSFHNANLITVRKLVNFRSSVAQSYVTGSLIIDSNSARLEDSNGISVIKDQSKYYNSPFMLNVNNSVKPNWVTNGIQFDGASYLRCMHNKYLNLDSGLSVFVVIENLQSTSGLRILSKSMGTPSANDINASDWSFSTDGLTVGACYTTYADLTTTNNYILASTYDSATNSFYNYKNGVNRGTPASVVAGTWSTDKIIKTATYTAGNTAELRIGNRAYGSAIPFTSKIKALHIIPVFKNSTDMIAYMNALNAIYAIY